MLTPSSLDGLLRIIAGTNRVDFIPADHWEYRDDLKAVLYPREQVMKEPSEVTSGQIYQKGGYACHSQGKSDPWRHIDRAITRANKAAGCNAVAARSAQAILLAIEEERVENLQRELYPNLGNYSLPRRDQGYRAKSYTEDLLRIHIPLDIGKMESQTDIPDFWLRAAIATKLIGSQALRSDELPQDMPWDQELITTIVAACSSKTQDEMLRIFEKVVAGIGKARIESYTEPPVPEPETEQEQQSNRSKSDQSNNKNPSENKPDENKNESSSPSESNSQDEQQSEPENDGDQDKRSSSKSSENENNSASTSDSNQPSGEDSPSQDQGPEKASERGSKDRTDKEQDDKQQATDSADESEKSKQEDGDHNSNVDDRESNNKEQEDTKNTKNQTDKAQSEDVKPETEETKKVKKAVEEETKKTAPETKRDPIDFVSGNAKPNSPSTSSIKEKLNSKNGSDNPGNESRLPPKSDGKLLSWEAISSTTTNITAPIRRSISQYFRDNEAGGLVKRLRRGQYDVKARMNDKIQGIDRPEVCRKRSLPKTKSYDIYFLIDVSGSMGATIEGSSVDFRVFGLTDNTRWMMATRMVVAIAKVFDSIAGIRYAIGVHDSEYKHLKSLSEPMRDKQKRVVLDHIGAFGGTKADEAYKQISKTLGASKANSKTLIHLTDGHLEEGGYSQKIQIGDTIKQMERQGIEIIVLTVGIDATRAKQLVGDIHADEVTDSTVGRILGRHLKRVMT